MKKSKNTPTNLEKQPDAVIEVQGQLPSVEDGFWLDTARQLVNTSITAIEEAAKQIIGLVTLLQGIFFAVITVSDLKLKLAALAGQAYFWILLSLMVLPMLCWIFSLWWSVLVFLPRSYSLHLRSPDLSREAFNQLVEHKHKHLLRAYRALTLSFLLLLMAIVAYLLV